MRLITRFFTPLVISGHRCFFATWCRWGELDKGIGTTSLRCPRSLLSLSGWVAEKNTLIYPAIPGLGLSRPVTFRQKTNPPPLGFTQPPVRNPQTAFEPILLSRSPLFPSVVGVVFWFYPWHADARSSMDHDILYYTSPFLSALKFMFLVLSFLDNFLD